MVKKNNPNPKINRPPQQKRTKATNSPRAIREKKSENVAGKKLRS